MLTVRSISCTRLDMADHMNSRKRLSDAVFLPNSSMTFFYSCYGLKAIPEASKVKQLRLGERARC